MERGFFFCQNGVSACVRERNGRKRKKVLWEMAKSRDFWHLQRRGGRDSNANRPFANCRFFLKAKTFIFFLFNICFSRVKETLETVAQEFRKFWRYIFPPPPPFFPRLSKRERNGRRRRDRPSKKKQRRNFRRRRRGILTQIFGLEKEEKQKKYFGGKTVVPVGVTVWHALLMFGLYYCKRSL